ncbi:hypothetical protein SAMN02745823_02397 [Sporobacter termitidis DSM 10068]|uniref:DUF2178 domain-containing protein n=1 Tax=Sporobacter termitidis DSM 10068 TaxID=1123282 RepID=A0A1M5YDE1_9FIRM|nr:hypothetical protein [Sporobacter termitidis]SHI09982.1 hypothetical protein SAMN02745823_02397 [Sporobacter termitidis DSM 10068]
MYAKSKKGALHGLTAWIAGIVSLAVGIIGYLTQQQLQSSTKMFLGMLTGFGFGILAVAVFGLLHQRLAPAKKLRQEEINSKDERNIQLTRASYTAASVAATVLFAVLAFLFMGLGYIVPAFVTVGAMLVQAAVIGIAYRIYGKRM